MRGKGGMTDDELRLCEIFMESMVLLNVDETGLTADNLLTDMNAVAWCCLQVKAMTDKGNSPSELALHRLALLTEGLLVTYIFPSGDAVSAWRIARSELLELQIPRR
jgi:hypothetical protein